MRVTASKPGKAPGTATSAATAPVAKSASTVRASVNRTEVKAGRKVTVSAVVSAPGVRPAGKVRVVVDGKTVRTVALKNGKAKAKVVVRKGKHRVVVRYLGSSSVGASTSTARTVRGT